ncbi:MAG TPA: iron-containing redox enzyme family protein [Paucimonas sp.]|nr:iron-containing redox enzyme family protein [Paucimonas sp.]
MLETLKQIHCFSAYYERLITRRLATFRMNTNRDLLSTARHHLMEEIGHPDLFRACLIANGLSDGECDEIVPGTHTKALFGFLLATIDYEDEYVGSVAMLQAMESIGKIFFDATLASMRAVGMAADVFAAHSEADNDHAELGYDELADCDPYTIKDCIRVIDDIYVLMDHFLDQFI